MLGILPKSKLARREALWFYFFISPFLIGFLLFRGGPIIGSLLISFTDYQPGNEATEFVGFINYTKLFADKVWFKSLQVSSYYTLLSVPLGLVASLGLALLLNTKNMPFLGVFRTLYYIPSLVASSVAVALLFTWLLNPSFGIVNYVIRTLVGTEGIMPLGIIPPKWFFDPNWVVPSFVLLSLWGFGGSMLIYLAGLQGVPTTLYEAATIDGANTWQKFRNVTIPMISPVILFTFITGIIGSFQVFTPAYIISGSVSGGGGAFGGPAYASMFYVLYLYLNAFRRFRFGFAAAQAWILFIIILILTILALKASREAVYYENPGDENTI